MIDTSWRIEDPDPEEATIGNPSNGFVSLHFLRSALRRRWWVWMAVATAGMLLGITYTVLVPAQSQGTVTLLLVHAPSADPAAAMATDVSLLRTRTVATSVVDDLGLKMTPEVFQQTVTATPVTNTILVVNVAAPDDASGVARTKALAGTYLKFRATALDSQAQALINGYQQQVNELNKQAETLSKQYNALSASGAKSQSQASEVLTQRTTIQGEVGRVEQEIEDTKLQANSVDQASHVLDPPSAIPRKPLKRIVLNTGAGLIAGLAIGIGLVLFRALTSSRLRRRDEVAVALAAPVRFSAGRIRGRGSIRRLLGRRSHPERALEVLAQGLESALTGPRGRQARLALIAVDDVADAALVTARLAAHLHDQGRSVFLVDLTESGRLKAAAAKALRPQEQGPGGPVGPLVFRPKGPPAFARGPIGAAPDDRTELPKGDPRRAAWSSAEVVLTLAEVDPAVGVDHLASWVDRVVLLVAAGRSSAERVRTAGELVRTAGLQLAFAMLVGADRTDESSGRRDPLAPGWTGSGKESR